MFRIYNRVKRLLDLAKTQIIYKPFFGHLGRQSTIGKPTLIANPQHISIGEGVSIRDGIRLETVLSSKTRIPKLMIGNNVNIEQNVHIVCHNIVTIEDDVSITGQCAIVDTSHPYQDVDNSIKIGLQITDDDAVVRIGKGCFIGFGSVILPNTDLGERVIVGAHSVVTGTFPDHCVVAGAPARIIRQYDFSTHQWQKANEG